MTHGALKGTLSISVPKPKWPPKIALLEDEGVLLWIPQ